MRKCSRTSRRHRRSFMLQATNWRHWNI